MGGNRRGACSKNKNNTQAAQRVMLHETPFYNSERAQFTEQRRRGVRFKNTAKTKRVM